LWSIRSDGRKSGGGVGPSKYNKAVGEGSAVGAWNKGHVGSQPGLFVLEDRRPDLIPTPRHQLCCLLLFGTSAFMNCIKRGKLPEMSCRCRIWPASRNGTRCRNGNRYGQSWRLSQAKCQPLQLIVVSGFISVALYGCGYGSATSGL
jgi:hypothetical protein